MIQHALTWFTCKHYFLNLKLRHSLTRTSVYSCKCKYIKKSYQVVYINHTTLFN